MTAAERQDLIVAVLRKQRSVVRKELAAACGCNERTIRRDIVALSVSGFPVEAVPGNGGGVRLAEWYQPHRSTLCQEQLIALREAMKNTADPQMRTALCSILDQFGPRR